MLNLVFSDTELSGIRRDFDLRLSGAKKQLECCTVITGGKLIDNNVIAMSFVKYCAKF